MSVEKTKNIKRTTAAVGLLHANPLNPNEMDDKTFNLLSDNIEQMGITDPILVMKHETIEGEYMIVGGQHRWEVAKMQGYTEVPITLITDPEFGKDQLAFQTVRHNIIGGRMSAEKFAKLFASLDGKYGADVASELFGFTDEAEFKKLIGATVKSLPKELQSTFKDAAKEVKTIDDLAKLLNSLFANFGDTLPQGYMIFDYGGYESIWLRLQANQLKGFRTFADQVRKAGKSVDHVMAGLIEHANSKAGAELVLDLITAAPEIKVKEDAPYATLDFLDS